MKNCRPTAIPFKFRRFSDRSIKSTDVMSDSPWRCSNAMMSDGVGLPNRVAVVTSGSNPQAVSVSWPRFFRPKIPYGLMTIWARIVLSPTWKVGIRRVSSIRQTTPLPPWRLASLSPTSRDHSCSIQTRMRTSTPSSSRSPSRLDRTLTAFT